MQICLYLAGGSTYIQKTVGALPVPGTCRKWAGTTLTALLTSRRCCPIRRLESEAPPRSDCETRCCSEANGERTERAKHRVTLTCEVHRGLKSKKKRKIFFLT
ncbi:hypothetical protein JOB18_004253 [Solea senegalensis]|uniref:Uncharacterized protein n=1 Tax=Solea senegalensis TaxID=28829 RepID=A0AAV6RCA5_SOLSE|nr:hypothetical protein JOB18_004253 [Solea senegalensis]